MSYAFAVTQPTQPRYQVTKPIQTIIEKYTPPANAPMAAYPTPAGAAANRRRGGGGGGGGGSRGEGSRGDARRSANPHYFRFNRKPKNRNRNDNDAHTSKPNQTPPTTGGALYQRNQTSGTTTNYTTTTSSSSSSYGGGGGGGGGVVNRNHTTAASHNQAYRDNCNNYNKMAANNNNDQAVKQSNYVIPIEKGVKQSNYVIPIEKAVKQSNYVIPIEKAVKQSNYVIPIEKYKPTVDNNQGGDNRQWHQGQPRDPTPYESRASYSKVASSQYKVGRGRTPNARVPRRYDKPPPPPPLLPIAPLLPPPPPVSHREQHDSSTASSASSSSLSRDEILIKNIAKQMIEPSYSAIAKTNLATSLTSLIKVEAGKIGRKVGGQVGSRVGVAGKVDVSEQPVVQPTPMTAPVTSSLRSGAYMKPAKRVKFKPSPTLNSKVDTTPHRYMPPPLILPTRYHSPDARCTSPAELTPSSDPNDMPEQWSNVEIKHRSGAGGDNAVTPAAKPPVHESHHRSPPPKPIASPVCPARTTATVSPGEYLVERAESVSGFEQDATSCSGSNVLSSTDFISMLNRELMSFKDAVSVLRPSYIRPVANALRADRRLKRTSWPNTTSTWTLC